MKKILTTVLFLAAISFSSYAQSAADMAMAMSMAKSYGYTDEEIDKVLNHDIDGNASGPVIIEKQTVVPNQPLSGDVVNGVEEPIVVEPIDGQVEKSDIFGHDFFISKGLSLIPSVTAPVPESYVLGPGDQVLIDIWGNASASFDLKVASNGSISVPKLGPVYVSGKKLSDAESYLRSKLSSIYSGLNDGTVSLNIAVGKIRGVSVYVLGAVKTPGVYTLPSLCSAATAIYLAGGIKKMGSVRNIYIYRQGKKVATFDLYKFIFDGEYNNNLRLQDGDIISVSTVENVVDLIGPVRTENKYELKADETLEDLFRYAGGFKSKARTDLVHVNRKISIVATSYDVTSQQFPSFKLCNGDEISVMNRTILYDNKVTISGNVKYPGTFSISDKISTLKDLIDAAGGLLEGTYMRRASIVRLDKDRIPSEVSFVPQEIIDGTCIIYLSREDEVRIFSSAELKDNTTITISGYVNNPGQYDYRNGMTLGDALLLSQGLSEGADLNHVEIASRGGDEKAQVKSLNLSSDEKFMYTPLAPYDIIYIRPKENFRPLKSIEIKGEVKFPGLYAVEKNTVRISDVLERASGFTEDAYVKGTKLKRKYTDEELVKAKIGKIVNAQKVTDQSVRDSIMKSDSLAFGDYFYVALDVEDAIKNPGSDVDVILRDGDIIEVPQMNNTVKISGGVYLPNTVTFNAKSNWREYVNMAGGFSKNARRSELFAIYQDGSTAKRGSAQFHMEPGMEIFVPVKDNMNKRQISAAEIASLTSAVSSIVYMSAILLNQLKK